MATTDRAHTVARNRGKHHGGLALLKLPISTIAPVAGVLPQAAEEACLVLPRKPGTMRAFCQASSIAS